MEYYLVRKICAMDVFFIDFIKMILYILLRNWNKRRNHGNEVDKKDLDGHDALFSFGFSCNSAVAGKE